jgi:hypothetical protein
MPVPVSQMWTAATYVLKGSAPMVRASCVKLTRRRLTRTDVQEGQLGGAFSEWPTIHPEQPLDDSSAVARTYRFGWQGVSEQR